MHLLITCIRTMLIPLASSNVGICREIENTTNITMNRMEEKFNNIVQRTIDVALAWVTKLLATQKKNDFRPRDDGPGGGGGAWLEMLQTPVRSLPLKPDPMKAKLTPSHQTCLSIFTFLTRLHNLVHSALTPSPNLTSFLTEIAIGIRTFLFEHFKKFQVNAAGALIVTKDITKYIELLRGWDLDPTFQPTFEVLTEIGNIFVIGPEALKERLRGKAGASVGGLWEKGDMRAYVLRRDDAGSVGIQSVLGAL